MRRYYKDYLFQKHILVAEADEPAIISKAGKAAADSVKPATAGEIAAADFPSSDETFAVLFALAHLFGIRITEGEQLAQRGMIRLASAQLGEDVPEPFYRGFPESVRNLTREELYYDQMLHYWMTYGMGDFSETRHSVFEETFERTAFKEKTQVREFVILTEAAAEEKLRGLIADLLAGTRPLNEQQYGLVRHYLEDFGELPGPIASKNTAVRLLVDLWDLRLAATLRLSDVIKVVEELNYRVYDNKDIRQLNLKNQDRKFLTALIDWLFAEGRADVETCCEKKKAWNGLLHHLHYRAKSPEAQDFVNLMRGRENQSVYAAFERYMTRGQVREALACLRQGKGESAVLRHLDYLVSRCESEEDVLYIADSLTSRNGIVLTQLLIRYAGASHALPAPRSFRFTKFNLLRTHRETEEERAARRSHISADQARLLEGVIRKRLQETWKGRLGRVWIDPDMRRYALPLQETTSQGGYGVLPKGTRLPIPEGKILRAFTYWEKVHDIDLSAIGLDDRGGQTEFSWRTMVLRQALGKRGAITFSGDETSGYNGGSEYFDIKLESFRKKYPDIHYLIFCDNVFSTLRFSECVCRAGYMLRDSRTSGQIYEPKTVESAFTINCESRFAYLFALDLERREFVWLNVGRDSEEAVAGATALDFLTDYLNMTDIINLHSFCEMAAGRVVDRPEEAEVIVTDKTGPWPAGAQVIREYDFEKIMALMQ